MSSASETGNGVLEACEQRGVSAIGYILDQSHLAPKA
jgi:basic membrane lipoprotein Med (substrate-binding protein (PBP1-ABC) superfamily)